MSGIYTQAVDPADIRATGEETVLDLFAAQVMAAPTRLAVVHDDAEFSYRDLDRRASSIAIALMKQGVQAGARVGMRLQRSTDAIAAMLATFKLGAAFVPLDPDFPEDRIAFMLEDAKIALVLVDDDWLPPASSSTTILAVDSVSSADGELAECVEAFQPAVYEDLAYVMYTSGSTGKPKGVLIDHRALACYCHADASVYRLHSDDRTLQFSTLCFDIAIEEIFPPLICGSAVVVRPSERADSANELSAIVDRYGITALHLATAYWHEWVDLMVASGDAVPLSLRLVIATGEKVSTAHYRRWIDLCQQEVLWCNAYGPTEATVSATVFIPDREFDREPMPIGKALPGYDAWILDNELKPVACESDGASETGTLYVGGPALALGYLNRPELTEKVFVDVELPPGTQRLYSTGDLARWLPDGNIEFGGRVDHQIKLGSYRIEPGEIEAGLVEHPAILESLVLHEQVESQKYLIAYVVTQSPDDLDLLDVARHVRGSLPAYMVPHRYCVLPNFPKTINGKIDRAALPDPSTAVVPIDDDFEAPITQTQQRLAEIWSQVLQVPKIGLQDDFFFLGGSSLLAARVISELKRSLDVELPVRDFFAKPTLIDAAGHVDMLCGRSSEPVGESSNRAKVKPAAAFFTTDQGNHLFEVRYRPPADNDRRHCLLVCHPWGHEYTRSYRNLQQLGVQLASQGITTHRFDYAGTGNSTGSRATVSVESMQRDTFEMLNQVIGQGAFDNVTVLGVRLGATVAANAVAELGRSDINFIAWDPIVDGSRFVSLLRELHTYALQSQTRFVQRIKETDSNQLYGYHLSERQLQSMANARFPLGIGTQIDTSVMLSQAYSVSAELQTVTFVNARMIETNEEIYWENPEYTERAFASRQIATALSKQLGLR